MLTMCVLDIQPHPDQATNNPNDWAVQFEVSYDGRKRTFWRWHTVREGDKGLSVDRHAPRKYPAPDEIVRRFWDDTFAELHGFAFNKDDLYEIVRRFWDDTFAERHGFAFNKADL